MSKYNSNALSIEGTKNILEQMKNCVFKIFSENEVKGTGFFCNIPYQDITIPVMITNYHIINLDYIKNYKNIKIILDDDKEERTIKINNKRLIYTNEEYDVTIIEIIPFKDRIFNFMELEEKIFENESNIIYNKEYIYTIHYPLLEKVFVSYGKINNIKEFNIIHDCFTDKFSFGAPICNILTNKIIGILKEESKSHNQNYGTFLKNPINDFINKNIKYIIKKKEKYNIFEFSDIINNKEDAVFILNELKKKINDFKMKMIYKATIQGDNGKNFKKFCNNKGPTITIIKSENNEIFGGFTKCNWTNENFIYGNDKDAFLFSITNKKIFDVIKPENAIINYRKGYVFACFGNTNKWDGIYLGDGFLNKKQCYCNPKKLTEIYNISEKQDLCSLDIFNSNEVEVYQIK